MTNQTILTPITLWEDFNENLPLKEVFIKSVQNKNARFYYTYFSGRKIENERVRIFGLFGEPNVEPIGTILILPNVSDTVDFELVDYFVSLNYAVLSVDLRGSSSDSQFFTKYPDSVSYANYLNFDETFSKIVNSAKETCWYEWTSVGRYAVSFLKNKYPNLKLGVIGNKYSADVLWQLSATDKRIDAITCLFGAGWLAYKDKFKRMGDDIEMDDERYSFIAGVDAQSYAKFVEVPVLFLSSTNNEEFDAERALDTLVRLNNQDNYWLNYVTTSKNLLDVHALNDIKLFFEKFIVNNDSVKLYKIPQLEISVDDNDDAVYELIVENPSEIASAYVFANSGDVSPDSRVWTHVLNGEINEKGNLVFKRKILTCEKFELAFAIVKYKNNFTVSSKISYKQLDYEINKSFPRILYNSTRYPFDFTVDKVNTKIIGNVFSTGRFLRVEEGPNKIKGLFTANKITSYAIKNISSDFSEKTTFLIDVYEKNSSKITFSVHTDEDREYYYTITVKGMEKWQKITFNLSDFTDENGMFIREFDNVSAFSISSQGYVGINNLIVL